MDEEHGVVVSLTLAELATLYSEPSVRAYEPHRCSLTCRPEVSSPRFAISCRNHHWPTNAAQNTPRSFVRSRKRWDSQGLCRIDSIVSYQL